MRKRALVLILATVALGIPTLAQTPAKAPFIVRPYVQIGGHANDGVIRLELLWHVEEGSEQGWSVKYGSAVAKVQAKKVAVVGPAPHFVMSAMLDQGLKPGAKVSYEVIKDGSVVFKDEAQAPKLNDQAQTFALFGDCGRGTRPQMDLAKQLYSNLPDYAMITGDIVYPTGSARQYRQFFYPYYNSEEVPVMSKIPFISAPGNHDTAYALLNTNSDAFAYFYYWSQTLNGPQTEKSDPGIAKMTGPENMRKAIEDASGDRYPRMSSYSFDYGNVHWTVLDSNTYCNWREPKLRAWLENDLKAASKADWRFVAFHHPPFHSSEKHQQDRMMRSVVDLFNQYKVDIVFSGHVHNYQRTYPMTPDISVTKGREPDDWGLDKEFDGKTQTHARGTIYVVAGGGGAEVYDPSLTREPDKWNPFTKVYQGTNVISFAQVKGRHFSMKTVGTKGNVLDEFSVDK